MTARHLVSAPTPGPEVYAEGEKIRTLVADNARLKAQVSVYVDFAYVVRNGYDVAKAVSVLDAALAKIT